MQVKSVSGVLALVLAGASPAAAEERRPDRGRHGMAPIVIAPEIVIGRDRRPAADPRETIMADIETCVAHGVRLFVDCLRHTHGSVTIRRLEACVRSETIPDDPARVAACISAVAWR